MLNNFHLQNLMKKLEDETPTQDSVGGFVGPFNFMKEMAIKDGFTFSGLARIRFEDKSIHQQPINKKKTLFTSHDTLVARQDFTDGNCLHFIYLDINDGGLPVAMKFKNESDITTTPIYEHKQYFARKLTEVELREIFTYCEEHPECFELK